MQRKRVLGAGWGGEQQGSAEESSLLSNINSIKCALLPILGADYTFLSFVQANLLGTIWDSAWA